MDYFLIDRLGNLKLSAGVRDYILPHRFVKFEIGDDYICIIPTDESSDYVMTLSNNNQASVCYAKMQHFIEIPQGVRIKCIPEKGGSLMAYINKKM